MIERHKLTTEEFIERARKMHGDKYDYSQTLYYGKFKKVKIICFTHGEFFQEAHGHLKGKGCIKCAKKDILTTEEFIKRAEKIHGGKYNYSKTIYETGRKSLTIICPIHGEFIQEARGHLTGRGCQKCAGFGRTREVYIQEAKKVHGDKYDYSNMEYSPQIRKVEIICRKHGKFKIGKTMHILHSQGCPSCSSSHGEMAIKNYLIKNNIDFIQQKTFPGCKNIKVLQFDFYIPSLNICIEYDGQQHFKALKCFGGKKTFIILKKCDKIKNDFCLQNFIPLYRIRYDENAFESLNKIFYLSSTLF